MARQSTTPVEFQRTIRSDDAVAMTSGRAGKIVPVTYIPVLRGDSGSGRVGVDIELAEMPRPLLNGVIANFQAWFIPKSAHPQFSGYDEFIHSFHGEQIKALGQADRDPPDFHHWLDNAIDANTVKGSELFKTLGIHMAGNVFQMDLVDAYNLMVNFRLAAHSSRLTRRPYAAEDLAGSTALARAFWPSNRYSKVVPDYERALIVGSLDLDVLAGQLPISGLYADAAATAGAAKSTQDQDGNAVTLDPARYAAGEPSNSLSYLQDPTTGAAQIFAEMAGQSMGVTLADIDKARTTQAFAKLRTSYAGNDATGFDNDDALVAELMQGLRVPPDQFKRPILLDSARVPFGMTERHATDAANLDASVSTGRCSAMLSLNVPQTETGGVVIVTVEVLPERLYERQSDEWIKTGKDTWPDALRDVQRPEPVDIVTNRRIDALHTTPLGAYGYEPMNDKWNRSFTRLGGSFYQDDPANPWTEQRSAIWQTSVVDPEFNDVHYLAPDAFPHDVFSDTTADAFEVVCRHTMRISGLTQIGDVLAESNDDYDAIIAAQE